MSISEIYNELAIDGGSPTITNSLPTRGHMGEEEVKNIIKAFKKVEHAYLANK